MNEKSFARRTDRFWYVVFGIVALLLFVAFLPIAILSTYNFINADDVGLYLLARDRGWLATTAWFVEYSMVRPTFIGLYSGLAELTYRLGISPLGWQRLSVAVDYILMISALTWLVKVLIPRIPVTLSLALALLAITGTFVSSQSGGWPVASNLLLVWVVANYAPAFAFYCATLAAFAQLVSARSRQGLWAVLFVILFALYAGAHEVNVVGGVVLLTMAFASQVPVVRVEGARLLRWRWRIGGVHRFVLWAVVVSLAIALLLTYLHLNLPSFDNRASYTNKVPFAVAAEKALVDLVSTVPRIYFAENYFLLMVFIASLLTVRRYGLNPYFSGWRAVYLLLPVGVFVIVVMSTFAGSYIQTNILQPRLLNYGGLHLTVAVIAIACLLMRVRFVRERRLIASRVLITAVFAVAFGTLANHKIYGEMVETTTGVGYKFARSLDRREDLLYLGQGEIVRFPVFHLLGSYPGGTPIPWAPLIGMPPTGPAIEDYKSRVSKIYGVKGVEIVECEKSAHLSECFYVEVP